jgi:hypothetical protein
MGIDANGHSGALALGWLPSKIIIINSWALDSTIGADIQIEGMGFDFRIVNIYGPYDTRNDFWESIFKNPLLQANNTILGGDINFSLGVA